MKIVVIGGTGLIWSKVVEKLKHKGHEAIAAAPNTGVNTITREGLAHALAGAHARWRKYLVDCDILGRKKPLLYGDVKWPRLRIGRSGDSDHDFFGRFGPRP